MFRSLKRLAARRPRAHRKCPPRVPIPTICLTLRAFGLYNFFHMLSSIDSVETLPGLNAKSDNSIKEARRPVGCKNTMTHTNY